MAFWVLQLCLCQRRDGRWGPAPPAPHISENARVSVPNSGEQKSVTTPQAARGWARPPCRHFKDQSCILPGSAFEVTAAFQTLARAHQYTGRRPRKIHPRSNMDRNTLSCAASYLSWAGDSHSQMPNDSSTDSHPLYASLVRCCHPAAATPSEPRRAATPPCPFCCDNGDFGGTGKAQAQLVFNRLLQAQPFGVPVPVLEAAAAGLVPGAWWTRCSSSLVLLVSSARSCPSACSILSPFENPSPTHQCTAEALTWGPWCCTRRPSPPSRPTA
jgi:hypothetical protein